MSTASFLSAKLSQMVPEPTHELAGPVFVLGAGFSRAISTAMPLLKDLSAAVWERYVDRDNVPDDIAALAEKDIEEALSYLTQSKPWLRESEQLRHRALFLELTQVVSAVIGSVEADVISAMATGSPSWINDLIRYWHQRRCAVLTLNYDTLIERIGGEFRMPGDSELMAPCAPWIIYPPILTNAAARSGSVMTSYPNPSFQLLKLHGSVNWFYSGRDTTYGETIYYIPPLGPEGFWHGGKIKDEQRKRASVSDKYPFIVPPVFDKSVLLTHETVRSIWFKGSEALRAASRVIFIGYSLPKSDRTMLHFLRTSMNPMARLDIVAPPGELLVHYRANLAFPAAQITQPFGGVDCVRNLVASLAAEPIPKG
jgi:hypothetical protein